MTVYRDIVLKRRDREDLKQDKLLFKRAVLTTEGGLQTSTDPFNDVWANSSLRRVFYMAEGAVQPAQILCRKISDPYVGLGVIIGYADGSNQLEVLSDDFFLTHTGDPTGWASTSPRDFEPGGRKQMWVYTKVITPLATYPGSGVAVNVILGDYPYLGTRKSFAGSVNYDLSASVPAAGLCRYAGLYLDAANTLQVVNGATIAAGSTPAEPSWSAGAFRLCVVLLTNGDTSIDFANIIDRRMAWSDEEAGAASSWPFAHVLTVSTTDPDAGYSTIAAAIAASSAGDIILLDGETYSESPTVNKAIAIVGLSKDRTIISGSLNITAAAEIRNLSVILASSGSYAIQGTINGILLDSVYASHTSVTNARAFNFSFTASATVTMLDCSGYAGGSSTAYALYTTSSSGTGRIDVYNGNFDHAGGANLLYADTGGRLNLFQPVLGAGGITAGAGSVYGSYFFADGSYNTVPRGGFNTGIWSSGGGFRIYYLTIAAAITGSLDGFTVKLDTDTYSVSASQNIAKSLTIEGDGPEATIYTTSVSNSTAFDITADNITVIFKDLTIKHTGGGTAATGIFSNNSGVTVVLDNVVVEISSGAGTDSRGLWIEAGTWILRNGSKIVITSGTNKYGIYNDSAAATITIGAGCAVGGATADIYSDQASSVITLNSSVLTNSLVNWAGIVNWEPENKIVKNLLYNSLTHNIWQRGTTLNDLADDSYGPDCWNVLNKDNAPDISGQAGGATDPFTESFRCTFDSNTAQAGIVQFLEAEDTYPLRGQVVSISADLWGTNVTTLRMAVVVWTSTADTLTSDIVGTWGTGNPTLATNWAYIGTPAAITITSTRTRYAVNNLLVPTNANNLGVFIWTDAAESSGDLWEVARVQLERGPVATEFVARTLKEELLLCQRYFCKSFPLTTAPAQNTATDSGYGFAASVAGANTNRSPTFTMPVEMRVVPTLTTYNPEANNANPRDSTNAVDCTLSLTAISTRSFYVNITGNAGSTVGARLYFNWTMDAGL